MTSPAGEGKVKLWTIVATLAAGIGLVWFGWTRRPPPPERAPVTVPASIHDEMEKNQALGAGHGARLSSSRPASEDEKIDRLLRFVERSGVVFIRNGTEYDGAAAAAHLREKLRASGLEHPTVDEFIEKIASRSSVTGRPYQVRLVNGETVDAGPWFRLQYGTKSSNVDEAPRREGQ